MNLKICYPIKATRLCVAVYVHMFYSQYKDSVSCKHKVNDQFTKILVQ